MWHRTTSLTNTVGVQSNKAAAVRNVEGHAARTDAKENFAVENNGRRENLDWIVLIGCAIRSFWTATDHTLPHQAAVIF